VRRISLRFDTPSEVWFELTLQRDAFALTPWETVLGLALSEARSQPAGPMQTETVAVWLVPASVTGSHR